MNKTSIEWTDYSSNPVKYRRKSDGQVVNFCVKLSDGCTNCYAAAIERRFHNVRYAAQDMKLYEPLFNDKEADELLRATARLAKTGETAKVFIGDMTDVFGEWVPDEILDQLFAVMALCPNLTFQVLTKRAERMREYVGGDPQCRANAVAEMMVELCDELPSRSDADADRWRGALSGCKWPLPNVWLGVSAEDQERADERIPLLLQTPAAVRFVSYEPAIGPADFVQSVNKLDWLDPASLKPGGIDWIIVGGESGPGARPFDLTWALATIEQCRAEGVACFVKQMGSKPIGTYFSNKKGGDMSEWAPALRVREFPEVAR